MKIKTPFSSFLKEARQCFAALAKAFCPTPTQGELVPVPLSFNVGNLIANAIGLSIMGAVFSAIESQRGEMRNVDRYPRFFTLRLDHFKYGTAGARRFLAFGRQERRSLKSLGYRILSVT